jgi:hypothetical protein
LPIRSSRLIKETFCRSVIIIKNFAPNSRHDNVTISPYAKRKLKYSRNGIFNLLHYVEWDRIVTLTGRKGGLRVTLSCLLQIRISPKRGKCTWNSNLHAKCWTERRFHAFKFSDGYKSTMDWCSVYLTPTEILICSITLNGTES